MKQNTILVLLLLTVALFSPSAFAMGGSAQEEEGQVNTKVITPEVTAEAKPLLSSQEVAAIELEKSQTELNSLENEREKLDNYLDYLNKKYMKAKMARDEKKASQLKTLEGATFAQENEVLKKIADIRKKYPDIQPSSSSSAVASNIVYHDVEMGDTLVSISKKYYGSPDYYRQIAKLNNITDISNIPQGARLKIDLGLKKTEKPAGMEAAKQSEIVYHVVAAGDTLMSISRKYFDGSPSYYKEIAEMNGLIGYELKIGMTLKVDKSLKKPDQPKL
jgi:nucleoid-associated protein YgaU